MIKADSLVKKFDSFTAVDRVSFEIKDGEIFGLLGPNGAGKTTIIRMFTGVLKPTSGTANIGKYNIQVDPLKAKQITGVVPEMANAYNDLSAIRNLLLMGGLYGVQKEKSIAKAEDLLKKFNLFDKKNNKVKTFSKGMKQRLIIAMGLMGNPRLLFLDEPTAGLDVKSVKLIRGFIRHFNSQGGTVFLTTHNISEASELCERVAIMNHGKIVAIDRPEKLKHVIQSTSSIEVAFDKEISAKEFMYKGVIEVKKVGDKIKIYTKNPEDIIPMLVETSKLSRNKILSLNTLGPSLEDVFLKLTVGE